MILTKEKVEKMCNKCRTTASECNSIPEIYCPKHLGLQDAITRLETLNRINHMIIGTTAPFEKRMREGSLIMDINPVQWKEILEQALARCRELGIEV